jgi:hypothetical protein
MFEVQVISSGSNVTIDKVTDTYDLPVPSGSSLPVTYTVDRDNDILVVS